MLVLHLKRFSFDGGVRTKINTKVIFPLNLNLSQRISVDSHAFAVQLPLYELYGVINHIGTVDGGHYFSFGRISVADGTLWYKFDDSIVTQIGSADLQSNNAYVLFYRLKQGAG